MSRVEVCLYSYIQLCGCFRSPLVSFVTIDEFSVGSQNIRQGLVSHEVTVYLSDSDLFLTQ